MAIIKGLAGITKYEDDLERARQQRENKVEWLSSIWSAKTDPDVKVEKNGKVEIIFLQELDESSERYSEKNGLGFLAVEHASPNKGEFWKRTLCTLDEEHDFECWPCEKNKQMWASSTEADPYKGGWGVKTNLYINVLARYTNVEGDRVEKVFVLQRNKPKRGTNYVDDLIEFAGEDGFISNRLFILSRRGEGLDTVYKLTPKDDDAGVDVESFELFDLDALVREVPYAEQAAALGVSVAPPRRDIQDSASTNPEDEDDDWL